MMPAVRSLFWFLFAAFVLPSVAMAAPPVFPALTGRVVDEAQVISPQGEAQLTAELMAHERKTGQQVVVATVSTLQGLPIADYGFQLGRAWGIGQKDKDTGVVLLVAPKEREVRIEVGYGLEGTLTDAASRTIIERAILPQFRAGHMEQGIIAGAGAILLQLGGDASAAPLSPSVPSSGESEGIHPLLLLAIFIIFMMMRGGGGRRRRALGLGGLAPIIWRGGGGGRGGFRGGGGSFGGGGASGRW